MLISIDNFNLSINGNNLLINSELRITEGKKYGIVGRNGIGKSVLLKTISNREPPFDNLKVVKSNMSMLYLSQDIIESDDPPIEVLLNTDTERKELMDKLDQSDDETDIDYNEIMERLEAIDAYSAESKAAKILAGLGFGHEEMYNKRTSDFSGGWRMRISLAKALFIQPELLMLDEPSNHLDLHAVIWLEKYLYDYPNTLILVSHDESLLDSITDETLYFANHQLIRYKGNYSKFVKILDYQIRAVENAKRKGKKIDPKIPDIGKPPRAPRFNFPPPTYKARESATIKFNNVSCGYTNDNVLTGLDFGIYSTDRIVLVGKNGAGKSTLMKLINNEIKPASGEIDRDHLFKVACFHQDYLDQLDPNQTPLDYIRLLAPPEERNYYKYLGRFGIDGDLARQKIRTLSGGQKNRLVFAGLTVVQPHLLLLDEPTNNLDIFALKALAEGIQKYEGAVICITHNQRLTELCGDRIWVLQDNNVDIFDGNYEQYKRSLGY